MTQHKHIIFFGAPGVGKGTQAKRLSREMNLPHIDTGGLIRKSISDSSPLGIQAKNYVESGKLVPDHLIIELIKEKIVFLNSQDINGFILDGFPRTIPQADALQNMLSELGLSICRVVDIKAPKEVVIKRLSARRMCTKKSCGAIYNLESKPPKEEGKCDICHSELYQRADDSEEASAERIHEYESKTAPIEEYYQNQGLISEVDGTKPIDEVYNDIVAIVS